MHAIAVADRFVALHLEADQHLAADAPSAAVSASRPMKSSFFDASGTVKPMPGLERIGLVAELVAGEGEPRLDAQHVERLQPKRHQPVRLARLPDGVEHGERILGMAEHLVAELAGIAGARDDDRRAVDSRRCARW